MVRSAGADRRAGPWLIAAVLFSCFHERWLGALPSQRADEEGRRLLREVLTPGTTLLTGGPLHNPGALLAAEPGFPITRWVAQGGFASDPVDRRRFVDVLTTV